MKLWVKFIAACNLICQGRYYIMRWHRISLTLSNTRDKTFSFPCLCFHFSSFSLSISISWLYLGFWWKKIFLFFPRMWHANIWTHCPCQLTQFKLLSACSFEPFKYIRSIEMSICTNATVFVWHIYRRLHCLYTLWTNYNNNNNNNGTHL